MFESYNDIWYWAFLHSLFATCIFALVSCLFRSFIHFPIARVIFSLLNFNISLYILETNFFFKYKLMLYLWRCYEIWVEHTSLLTGIVFTSIILYRVLWILDHFNFLAWCYLDISFIVNSNSKLKWGQSVIASLG